MDTTIHTLTLNAPGGVNKVDAGLLAAIDTFLDALPAGGVTGIVIESAHRDFCVGADLDLVYQSTDPHELHALSRRMHEVTRRLETGPPVVSILTGNALGGGFELALGTHHRIAVAGKGRIGLPEVGIGVIPGGGGTARLTRLVGMGPALEAMLQARTLRPDAALGAGWVDDLVEDVASARAAAVAWLAANPKAKQPWDVRGWRPPGVRPGSPAARQLVLGTSAAIYKKTAGAHAAPEALLTVVQEGAALGFDAALHLEARAFGRLAADASAKAMIRTLFRHRTAARRRTAIEGVELPSRIGVLGAGMMGAGLAGIAARTGADVIVRDIDPDALEAAGVHLGKQRLSDGQRGAISLTTDLEGLAGCDLVIEAVPERTDLKHRVLAEIEPLLAPGGWIASNTSALPIHSLATALQRPERLIGMHFFSPVERMELVEIIPAERTDPDVTQRALRLTGALRKLPVLAGDSYGFFTTRVFSAYILEGAELVAAGVDPALIDWAARSVGMAVGPLAVFDEVTLTLGLHAMDGAAEHGERQSSAGRDLIREMVDVGRTGRADGAGFYDYSGGRRGTVWAGLAELAGTRSDRTLDAIAERLVLAFVAEAGRAMEEGAIATPADADLASVLGLGFAPNLGGPFSYADQLGIQELVSSLHRLAAEAGERFAPSQPFIDQAARGVGFYD